MPLRSVSRGCPSRTNGYEQYFPKAVEVQAQREVTNVEFCKAIRMLCQFFNKQVV